MPLPSSVPVLTADRVRLRPFADRDIAVVREVATDPMIPLVTTVPTSGDEADAVGFIRRQQGRLADGHGFSFAVADAATDEAVGQVGVWTSDLDRGRLTTGYWVARPFRRQGYARAALALATEWALGLDGVVRVQLFVEPANVASQRVAERCGYLREGTLRSWQRVGTTCADMHVYAVTADATWSEPTR